MLDASRDSVHTIRLPFPFFVKPAKSFDSAHAYRIDTQHQLQTIVAKGLPKNFFEPFNILLQEYSSFSLPAHYLLAEELLQGDQVTVEGFVVNDAVYILGIVDSIMYPGTISFARFEYPSSLKQDVQDRMHDIAERFMRGINFNNGFFNIEMMYNPVTEAIHIIEVNPRMASQFADLYEKVHGINSYDILLAIATGNKPRFTRQSTPHTCAASFVLRLFENKKVQRIPSSDDLNRVQERFPDSCISIFVKEGTHLSEYIQDGASYRYAFMNLGAANKEALLDHAKECERLLGFAFE